ncbi:MAG: DNA gyrase inhibitor YacG [Tepidisphaeraceae bacterium]
MLCPICKKEVLEREDSVSGNPFFPFCSDRCRLIDLGRWLGEKYQIPVKPAEDSEEPEPPDPGENRS